MTGKDEIIFTGEYKDFRLGMKFDVSGKQPAEVASALCQVSEKIEPHAFRFSGIDMKGIDSFASSSKGIPGIISFLDANSPGAIKEAIGKNLLKPELITAAESYLFNRLLSKAGVGFKPKAQAAVSPAEESIGDFIGFIGKFGNWISIKKLGLEKVQDYEVSGILSGINHTAVNKAFDFAGMKDDSGSVLKGKRKSYGNLSESLKELEGKMTGDDAMTVCRVFEGIGYRPYASPEMLTAAYPDIKPPKVKGRKPKG
jgi:hypothetical protein